VIGRLDQAPEAARARQVSQLDLGEERPRERPRREDLHGCRGGRRAGGGRRRLAEDRRCGRGEQEREKRGLEDARRGGSGQANPGSIRAIRSNGGARQSGNSTPYDSRQRTAGLVPQGHTARRTQTPCTPLAGAVNNATLMTSKRTALALSVLAVLFTTVAARSAQRTRRSTAAQRYARHCWGRHTRRHWHHREVHPARREVPTRRSSSCPLQGAIRTATDRSARTRKKTSLARG